jgi:hypothetical protein
MRLPVLVWVLMAAMVSACGQSLTHGLTGTGGTRTGPIGTGGSTCTTAPCECGVYGQQFCGGSCVDTTSDSRNCGSCGNACLPGQICANGNCTGCVKSDPPATAEIATFTSDGGLAPGSGLYTYGDDLPPTYTIARGVVNVVDTIQVGATNFYQGFGISFDGNDQVTDCVDASSYTGVAFSLSGSLVGTGCTMQFAIDDSEHDQSIPGVLDPKAAGPPGSYAPQFSISSADLTSTAVTIMVPFAGADAPTGGSPATPIDPYRLVGLEWVMSTPATPDAETTECAWNINISNVRFY